MIWFSHPNSLPCIDPPKNYVVSFKLVWFNPPMTTLKAVQTETQNLSCAMASTSPDHTQSIIQSASITQTTTKTPSSKTTTTTTTTSTTKQTIVKNPPNCGTKYHSIIHLCLSIAWAAYSDRGWTKTFAREGVQCYSRDGYSLFAKGRRRFNIDPETMFKLALDRDLLVETDPYVEFIKTVHEERIYRPKQCRIRPHLAFVDSYVLHTGIKRVWTLAPRQVIVTGGDCWGIVLPGVKNVKFWISAVQSCDWPDTGDSDRVTMTTKGNAIVIMSVPNDPNACWVNFISRAELGGWVPAWVMDKLIPDAVFETLSFFMKHSSNQKTVEKYRNMPTTGLSLEAQKHLPSTDAHNGDKLMTKSLSDISLDEKDSDKSSSNL